MLLRRPAKVTKASQWPHVARVLAILAFLGILVVAFYVHPIGGLLGLAGFIFFTILWIKLSEAIKSLIAAFGLLSDLLLSALAVTLLGGGGSAAGIIGGCLVGIGFSMIIAHEREKTGIKDFKSWRKVYLGRKHGK